MKTVFWREGGNYYRIQTENPEIHKKLKRRNEAVLCDNGINCPLWIYRLKYYSLKDAKVGFERICDAPLKSQKNGVYYI